MKKIWMVAVACMVGLFVSGCSYSKNMQLATARAGSGVAAKALLDGVKEDKYQVTKDTTILVLTDVRNFCDTGNIADLPIGEAKQKVVDYMTQKGWQAWIPLVSGIIDVVAAQHVPVDKLGPDNIYIIKKAIDEAIESATTSRLDWRVTTTTQVSEIK